MNKTEAQKSISEFFSRTNFSGDEVRKIRNIAMKYRIRFGEYRKLYCKKCLSKLSGKTRITKTHKTIVCDKCGTVNRFKLS